MTTWELIKEMGENGFYVERKEGIYEPIFFKAKITQISFNGDRIDVFYESEKEIKEPFCPKRILSGWLILDIDYKKTFWLKEDRSE